MEIRVASLTSGAGAAAAPTVIIDVFRAFTTAAVAFSRGASRIVMVDSLDKALALRSSGIGDYCIGERDSIKPPGFDFGNSPAELGRAEVARKTPIQTTSNGTAGSTRNGEPIASTQRRPLKRACAFARAVAIAAMALRTARLPS